jgi:predicted 3-demethylubiquinone-9 3-methyltransferase (glyoxalase superfamily)
MNKITPCLWFDNNVDEAFEFYRSVFKNSRLLSRDMMPDGKTLVILFEIEGQQFMALNGGPVFKHSEAFSIVVDCKTQEEVDELWSKLTAGGGEESMCGWLKDKFGISWQITPERLMQLMSDKDKEKSKRVMDAMLKMKKIDIKKIEEAANGE